MMRWATLLHPLFHRRGEMRACWICRVVWDRATRDPGFNEAMEQGLADIKAGRVHRWSDVRRDI